MARLIVAALTLLVTVAALFAAVAWNRSGDPQAIVVTERELALPWNWPSPEAEPRLRLHWQPRDEPQDARLWLNDVKLRELGFTTGVPAGAPEAESFYGRSLPRRAWVAFELGGPGWRAIEQRRRMLSAPAEPAAERHAGVREPSRLVPIDADPEPEPLRRRYSGQDVVVLPAVVRMRYMTSPTSGPSVWAEVQSLVADGVSIPARLRGRLPTTTRSPDEPPRYEVDLRVGRLGAAWVEEIRPLQP